MADDNVTHIAGAGVPVTGEAIRDAILADMEQILAKIHSGEIIALAFVAVHPNGAISNGWTDPSRTKRAVSMLAGTTMLQHDLLRKFHNVADGAGK